MTIDLPPSYKRKKDPPKYRCDTCGKQDCHICGTAVCWTHCLEWVPHMMKIGSENGKICAKN